MENGLEKDVLVYFTGSYLYGLGGVYFRFSGRTSFGHKNRAMLKGGTNEKKKILAICLTCKK
jgi:hypothetical protein